MDNERIKHYLDVWANWMRTNTYGKGYPNRSSVFASAGVSGFDDLGEEVENSEAVATDAAIGDLPMPQQNAIHHFHLSSVYTFKRLNIMEQYQLGLEGLERGLMMRGWS